MNPKLLRRLVCPEDHGPLVLTEEGRYLINPRTGYRYPIQQGIPGLLVEEGRANRVAPPPASGSQEEGSC